MKKKQLLWFIVLLLAIPITAQITNNIEVPTSINSNGDSPKSSAMLDVESTTQGILIPRMTTTQRTAISSPAMGLMVFDIMTNSFWFFNVGGIWEEVGDGGVFENNSGLVRNTGDHNTENFAFGDAQLPLTGNTTSSMFFFHKNQAAFRGGRLTNSSAWEPSKLGQYSFAYGFNCEASGHNSVAMGSNAIASSSRSVAIGFNTTSSELATLALGSNSTASEEYSVAIGPFANSTGNRSVAIGDGAHSNSYASISIGSSTIANYALGTVVGAYNDPLINTPNIGYSPSTPVFVVGNGWDDNDRSNALLVKQDGNIGLSNNDPEALLHVGTGTNDAIIIGSYESLSDQGFSTLAVNSTFRPIDDNTYDLGSPSFRWDDVYATNGTINTSDRKLKQNISNINYGLDAIMKLQPVQYQWKDQRDEAYKLGLIAQDVLEIVPEVVKTHDWLVVDETLVNGKQNKEKVKVENMGIYYSDLVPVLIQATKEQQDIIEAQQTEIENLKNKTEKVDELEQRLAKLEALLLSKE